MESNSRETNHITVMFSIKTCKVDMAALFVFSIHAVVINTPAKYNAKPNALPFLQRSLLLPKEHNRNQAFPSNHDTNLTVTEWSKAM